MSPLFRCPRPKPKPPDFLDTPFLEAGGEVILDYRRLCQGALVLGSIGSGKTSGVLANLARQIFRHRFPALFACPKEDDRARWMALGKEFGTEFVVVGPDCAQRLNFFEAISRVNADPATLSQMAATAFDQFLQVAGRNQQQGFGDGGKFWHEAYTRCLRTILHLFYLAGVVPSPAGLLRAVTDLPGGRQTKSPAWRAGYLSGLMKAAYFTCKENGWTAEYDPIEEYVTVEMAKQGQRTKSVIVATVTGVCDSLVRGKAASILGTDSTFDFAEVMAKRQVVLVDFPSATWGETGRFVTVGLAFLAKLAGRRREVREDTPVFPLVIDECQLAVTEDDWQHTAISRSARCPLVLSTQCVSQFWALFGGDTGRAKADVLTQNLGTIFATRPTHQTAKWISEQIGVERTRMRSSNVNFANAYTSPLDLMGFGGSPPQVSAGSSEQYQPVLRPEAMFDLRTSGGEVDCLVYQPGRTFSTGRSFTITPFQQV